MADDISQSSSTSAQTLVLDPSGDMILDCSSMRIRVSSNILRLASPQMRTRPLSNRFSDGTIKLSSADPPVIPHHEDEDNLEALRLLLSILYFGDVPTRIATDLLISFAYVCNYYDCSRVA